MAAMERKDRMDVLGAVGLIALNTVFALNQVAIKLTNAGIGPVFGAGLRSILALGVLVLWMWWRGLRADAVRGVWLPGLGLGLLFSVEFVLLFQALDLTTVSRASIIFYSMPVWLALTAHLLLPGERLSATRALGLVLAMAGVALALWDPQSRVDGRWLGDALALGAALCWMGIALTVRLTRLSQVSAETQLLWQLAVSSIVLTAVAPVFGPVLRDPDWSHWAGLAFQAVAVASLGFLFWFRLMRVYPASDVAAFSFLAPVLSVALGALILDEALGPGFLTALVLVAVGIVLINRPRRAV
jgi:drug/metabolite transporter (DMT)-like permease